MVKYANNTHMLLCKMALFSACLFVVYIVVWLIGVDLGFTLRPWVLWQFRWSVYAVLVLYELHVLRWKLMYNGSNIRGIVDAVCMYQIIFFIVEAVWK